MNTSVRFSTRKQIIGGLIVSILLYALALTLDEYVFDSYGFQITFFALFYAFWGGFAVRKAGTKPKIISIVVAVLMLVLGLLFYLSLFWYAVAHTLASFATNVIGFFLAIVCSYFTFGASFISPIFVEIAVLTKRPQRIGRIDIIRLMLIVILMAFVESFVSLGLSFFPIDSLTIPASLTVYSDHALTFLYQCPALYFVIRLFTKKEKIDE